MTLPLPRTSVPSSPTAPDPRDGDERPALILANLGTPAATHAQSHSLLPAGVPLRLDLPEGLAQLTFQSVFGPAARIGPATIDTIGELGRAGCPRLDVICPGFVSDCLETLEEINQLNRETFTTAGGGSFHYVPWGNDSDGAIAALAQQARKVLAGWI